MGLYTGAWARTRVHVVFCGVYWETAHDRFKLIEFFLYDSYEGGILDRQVNSYDDSYEGWMAVSEWGQAEPGHFAWQFGVQIE